MVKKIFILIAMFFSVIISANADILPSKVSDIPSGSIGVYQTNNGIVLRSEPEKNAKIIYKKDWSYLTISNSNFAEQLFAILQDKKELSFVYVNDVDEDFVQVIYNKNSNATGWAYKEDYFQFMPWITFYNMYGKKYGLKILKNAPSDILELHAKSEASSQVVDRLIRPKTIKLTAIQGNWALVTALDVDNKAKTGYLRWRSDDGELLVFPAMK